MRVIELVKQQKLLIAIMALASFLRIYNADYQSIWLDEIHTMLESDPKLTLKEFHEVMMFREGMGHLYFFILRCLYFIFGYTTLTARLFSAVIGILSVYALYLFGREIANKRTGLIAAALLAVNFYHISYSQEARPYALLVLFTIAAFYRLVVFINRSSLKNAILYGLFAGLIVNAHFVGLITVFAQFVLLLFILLYTQKEEKALLFKHIFIGGLTAFIVMLPTYSLFLKMSKYKSGWLTLPGPDGFTDIFRQFMGGTELLYFIFNLLLIFYFVNVFRQRETGLSITEIKNNKLLFGALLLFTWLFLPIPLSTIKSYLSEPMILSRYFIHLLPGLIAIFAISIDLIRNRIIKTLLITVIVTFALIDLFVVKNYYHKVSKTQFREITAELKIKNTSEDKIVSAYGWLLGYFLNEDKANPLIEMKFEAYIDAMRSKNVPMESFWYIDGNYRPYALSAEDEAFLKANFILKETLEKHDTWARHYISRNPYAFEGTLNINEFMPQLLDGEGNLLIFENGTVESKEIQLKKGPYNLLLEANSIPQQPINGEHARIKVKIDNMQIMSTFLKGSRDSAMHIIPFTLNKSKKVKLQIVYDNDIFDDDADRNVIIYSAAIKQKQ